MTAVSAHTEIERRADSTTREKTSGGDQPPPGIARLAVGRRPRQAGRPRRVRRSPFGPTRTTPSRSDHTQRGSSVTSSSRTRRNGLPVAWIGRVKIPCTGYVCAKRSATDSSPIGTSTAAARNARLCAIAAAEASGWSSVTWPPGRRPTVRSASDWVSAGGPLASRRADRTAARPQPMEDVGMFVSLRVDDLQMSGESC
jgi:hypothetical protein